MTVEIKVPAMGESVTEATISKWFKKEGDAVKRDEPLLELETDKVTVEVPSPADGALESITAQAGATVTVGALLGAIAEGKAGPGREGRVPRGDGRGARESRAARPTAAAAPAGPRAQAEREERVAMPRLRKTIALRLKESQNTAAQLTTFNEVDMTAVMALRAAYKDSFEKKHGVKLGFMGFFTKAVVAALKELPNVNAEIEGDNIVYKNYYDIGIAVSTERGLVVPVVRDADALSLAGIEKAIADFGMRARDNKLKLEELQGGPSSITKGGGFGSLMSTPILNSPQSGILGMHKIQPRPMAIGDRVEIRPMMYLALSYDHRLVDGREAVTFLVKVKDNLEDPQRLLLEV